MGDSFAAMKTLPIMIFAMLGALLVADSSSAQDVPRNLIMDPLSADELADARRKAFLGDGRSAYWVYFHLSAHLLDEDAAAYLRLSAELGHCEAVFEMRNKIRNQVGSDLSREFMRESRRNPRAKDCFN